MVLMKLYCHLMAEIKKIIYKLEYGNRVSFGSGFTFRKGFNLIVAKEGKVEIGANCFFNNRECSFFRDCCCSRRASRSVPRMLSTLAHTVWSSLW